MAPPLRLRPALNRRAVAAWLTAAALLCAVFIVDPFREFHVPGRRLGLSALGRAPDAHRAVPARRVVRGEHAGADLPRRRLAKVFGYSLSVLRVSTLLLLRGAWPPCTACCGRTSLPPAWPAAVREVLHSF
jgi:hypothetical protein